MIAGMLSMDFSLRSMGVSAGKDSALYVQTLAVVEHYRKAAAQATGDLADPGIMINPTNSNSNYTCFRQDLKRTPADYSDDPWVCFTLLRSAVTRVRENVHRCQSPAATACASSAPLVGRLHPDILNSGNLYFNTSFGLFTGRFTCRQNNRQAVSAGNRQVEFSVKVQPQTHSF